MDARTIESLDPLAYLDPDRFKTPNDHLPPPGYAEEQYQNGLRISQESVSVSISVTGTWGATGKDGSTTTSYERIGYHSCTAPLLRGLLDGPAEIVVFRATPNGLTTTVIRPAKRTTPERPAAQTAT